MAPPAIIARVPDLVMSVVMVDLHGDLEESLHAMTEQGPTENVEIVLVTPAASRGAVTARYPDIEKFGAVRLVPSGNAPTTAQALASGMRAATGPVVAYCEDHIFPEPGWVETRLEAHAEGAAVVASVLRNANPASAISWALFLQAFGPFAVPVAGGPSAQLPWHQCSYRRDALPRGPELDRLLEAEGLLHAELIESGHALSLEARCVASHLNPSRPRSLGTYAWSGGRLWGAGRARHGHWRKRERIVHALLTPHTILRELRGRLLDLHRVVPERRLTVAPWLAAAIIVHAAGEAAGVLFGERSAAVRLADIELNRRAHLSAVERASPP